MPKCEQCGNKCKKGRRFCKHSCAMIYRHSHKDEYKNYFEKLSEGAIKRRKPRSNCLNCGKENKKPKHKFCSPNCANKYRINHPEEYESSYAVMRSKVRKYYPIPCKYCGTIVLSKGRQKYFCDGDCFYGYKRSHPEEYKIDTEVRRAGYEKFRKNNPEAHSERCKTSSERMKNNNPMYNEAIKFKAMESNKKYWDSHPEEKLARIVRFINAPKRGRGANWIPTSLEQKIIDLNVPGLSYTGNGKVFVTIGCSRKRHKNPDFLLRGKKKVIEVGDTNYWHTLEEIAETIRDYECINYKCLYLTDKQMKNKAVYEKLILDFCKEE